MIWVTVYDEGRFEESEVFFPGVPRTGDEILTGKGPIIVRKVIWNAMTNTVHVVGRNEEW